MVCKKVHVKVAVKHYFERVRRLCDHSDIKENILDDVEKSRYSHREWSPASESTESSLEQKIKEPRTLFLPRGERYMIIYNKEGCFSQSQTAILLYLPSEDDLNNWRQINVLIYAHGIQYAEFDPKATKASYIENDFKEVKVGFLQKKDR